ncbi:protein SAR DEFICIENT 4-like [Salvia hispanica]|uniref:protein SAR DEFICIENT 4-like n=1 Tax=Salvia hispanica TaxID=49212 RepID=UPI0020095952|nr:protein SAR DEFICIENT 4-like [Salvia hispanica]
MAAATNLHQISVAAPPVFISTTTLHSLISHKSLIGHLKSSLPPLSAAIQSPLRHAHQISPDSSFLLMPSWSTSPLLPYIGTKLVTHNPNNSAQNLPGVHAIFVLFHSLTGQPLASMDATALTLYRTACISALASSNLSREDAEILVMVGAGTLAPHLIKAHLSVRSKLKRVIVWNRSAGKARNLVDQLKEESGGFEGVCFEANECLTVAVGMGDVISCATNSEVALVKGAEMKAGAHLDLVGSFKPSMRECDEEAVRRGRVFVDNEMAAVEAGELVMMKDEIVGGLVELIKGDKVGRMSEDEITVFKSVGSAVVDLLSAQMVYQNYLATSRQSSN